MIKDCKCIKNVGWKEMDVCCRMKFGNGLICTVIIGIRENKNIVHPKIH